MNLRGVEHGLVQGCSGLTNVYRTGYWYHKLLKFCPGFSLEGIESVEKTTTFPKREGNMPMRADGITPVEYFPKCIYVS